MSELVQDNVDVDRALAALEERFPPRGLAPGTEVTRVAPSPTGKPHIGTALQAIVDYALARKTDGTFILRIEDTDRSRLVPGAVEAILEGLDWIGVHADESPMAGGDYGPYVESERLDIYRVVAEWLVAHVKAYRCFCTPERLNRVREEQVAAKRPPRYDRHCRHLGADDVQERLGSGELSVVRLAMPLEGTIVYQDPVRGQIEFAAEEQDDPVILKSDGFPTYHLAAMVDDHFMRVTTAIRGEEWISSTPKHLVLFDALGWTPPTLVHTPLLRDAQGRKLGKRTGDTSMFWYRGQGYLPDAFRNFITRIIWANPDGRDVYPYEEFIQGMNVETLPKTGPIVSLSLLDFISGEWLRTFGSAELYDQTAQWLFWLLDEYVEDGITFEMQRKQERVGQYVSRPELERFKGAFVADRAFSERVLGLEPERYDKLGDIVIQIPLYYADLFVAPSADALADAAKGDRSLAGVILREITGWYTGEEPQGEWEARMDSMAQRHDVKRGVPFMVLRLAVSASKQTPPLHDMLSVLGPEEVKRRLGLSLEQLTGASPRAGD